MRILKNTFYFVALLISFISCSSDDVTPELTGVRSELSFTKDATSQKLTFKTNVKWTVSSSAAWCTVSPASGEAGIAQVEVSVTENTATEPRETILTVTAQGITEQVKVTQAQTNVLIVENKAYTVKTEGESITVKLQVSDSYQITINDSWITQTDTKAVSNKEEVFVIPANKNVLERTGTITIKLASITEKITITQPGISASTAADNTGMGSDAKDLAKKMALGWNLGNTLEAIGGETAWGNPKATEALIKAVKAQGINAIRIPCAWSGYIENTNTFRIKDSWLERVKEVVDYCVNNDMYAILNIHWDGGWLENNPTKNKQAEVNKKQKALWTQIAAYFREYDEHLLFAGTNEVHVSDVYSDPTAENLEVQHSYNQTFVDAVRATGGRNTYRNLIVQAYNTNIGFGVKYMKVSADATPNRMMVEVHYYDPYNFTLDEHTGGTGINLWGKAYEAFGKIDNWGQEDYLAETFADTKKAFVDKGYPVILGEFGALRRATLTGTMLEKHLESRAYYIKMVTSTAKKNGMVPFYWDNGPYQNLASGIFNRKTGTVDDELIMNALKEGATTSYPY